MHKIKIVRSRLHKVVKNFESLAINAIGDEKERVVRHLMDVGLLNATQYCAKDHDRKRMVLQENQK